MRLTIGAARSSGPRDGACAGAGNDMHAQACHIYGRRMKILRWSLDNLGLLGRPSCTTADGLRIRWSSMISLRDVA